MTPYGAPTMTSYGAPTMLLMVALLYHSMATLLCLLWYPYYAHMVPYYAPYGAPTMLPMVPYYEPYGALTMPTTKPLWYPNLTTMVSLL